MAKKTLTSSGGTTTTLSAQAKLGDGWVACSSHAIRYRDTRHPGCPVCIMSQRVAELERELGKQSNRNDRLAQDNYRLEAQVDTLTLMRDAFDLMDDDDRAFVKSFLYLWRDDPSLVSVSSLIRQRTIRVPNTGTVVRHEVCGFVVSVRGGGENSGRQEHEMMSVGGMALAKAFSEAIKVVGQIKASDMLVKAASERLVGGEVDA